ncbi:unnamed protein product [Caenorhabditis sp. 36 PRJEB53466]|nr:unnamed protein product [Caenorhabditis sp. 36 PRJEB53466]
MAHANGLSQEQTEQALASISKLKVHDLMSIISALNLRRPRNQKVEQQKVVYSALFEPQTARTVHQMAVGLSNGGYNEMSNRGRPARSQPYLVPAGRNGTNGHLMPHHQQMLHQQQQHHPGNPVNLMQQHQLLHVQQQQQQPSSMHQVRSPPPFQQIRLPFYDVVQTILAPVELGASMPATKQAKSQFTFQINADQMSKITYRQDTTPLPRFELQLRFFNLTDYNAQPFRDDFPLNAHVRVDDQIAQLPNVIPTNKPNMEPKRPSRPVNITNCLSRFGTAQHRIVIEWLADRRTWAAQIQFVHRVDAHILFDRVEKDPSKHKSIELTKKEIVTKLNGSGEDDIAMDHLQISLLDPLVRTRMVTPSRCADCTHLQCFDLKSYLMMNEKKATWQCPVCSNYCPYDRLIIEDYFLDMLHKVDKDTTEVELKADGTYDVIGRDDEVCLSDDYDDVKATILYAPRSSNGNGAAADANGTDSAAESTSGKRKKLPVEDDDIIVLSDDDDEDLNRGIAMSLNDAINANRRAEGSAESSSSSAAQKTPPRAAAAAASLMKKNGKEVEVITLDDTPPRPKQQHPQPLAPIRQISQPSGSSNGIYPSQGGPASAPINGGGLQTISDALAQIGDSRHQQPSSSQHQAASLMGQMASPAYMQQQMAAAVSTAQQYTYPVGTSMMQPHQPYSMQNGIIGRQNQMVHPQMQQQPPGVTPSNFYGQQQMTNARPQAPSTSSSAGSRACEPIPPGVTQRQRQRTPRN